MKIVLLEKKRRNVLITFEDQITLLIRYEIFVKRMIVKGDDLSEADINNLKEDNELFLIKESAINILSRRNHSTIELKRKLLKKEYSEATIETVISFLIEKKYLDDQDFAKKYAAELIRVKKYGSNKIRASLISKGIARDIIESIIADLADNPKHSENALILAEKKIKQLKYKNLDSFQLKQKVNRFLLGRGFSFEQISSVLENIKDSDEPSI